MFVPVVGSERASASNNSSVHAHVTDGFLLLGASVCVFRKLLKEA